MQYILGISAYYHDSAAAVLVEGQVIAAAQEERFSRIKNDAGFPYQAIKYCLEEAGITLNQLDAVVFYDKPFLKFERLLETYFAFAPKGFLSFLRAMPRWVKEQLLIKQQLRKALRKIQTFDRQQFPLLFSRHHLSHAASAFYPSPYDEAAILTLDGVGEWATGTLAYGKGRNIRVLKSLSFPHSLGLLYSAFTYFLGFRVNSGEYKLMGLAAYGQEQGANFRKFYPTIAQQLVDLKADGSLRLNQQYFTYATNLQMINDRQWAQLFGGSRRQPEDAIQQWHADLALAIQRFTEAAILRMAKELRRLTGARYLCYAGGVALNGVVNGKLLASAGFEEVFVPPAAGDAGGALGAALAVYHLYAQKDRPITSQGDRLRGGLLGPAYSDATIRSILEQRQLSAKHYPHTQDLLDLVSQALATGKIIGWFRGRMEFGPRALGHRSILADARQADMQKRLNLKIKQRESFRPFAPIILAEQVCNYVQGIEKSPYMNIVGPLQREQLTAIPEDYENWSIRDKLAFTKSRIPAVTHVDFTARIQTVTASDHPVLYELLQTFKRLTGEGVLVNTSFNAADEPIVCTPEDAIDCFLKTELDLLVLENWVIYK